jgi:hypothetical protein
MAPKNKTKQTSIDNLLAGGLVIYVAEVIYVGAVPAY